MVVFAIKERLLVPFGKLRVKSVVGLWAAAGFSLQRYGLYNTSANGKEV